MKKAHAGRADLWGGSPFSSRTSARAQEGSKKGRRHRGKKREKEKVKKRNFNRRKIGTPRVQKKYLSLLKRIVKKNSKTFH